MANGGAGQKRQASESAMGEALQSLQEEAETTTKQRRMEHHCSAHDALARQPSPTPPASVGMEDLPQDIRRHIMSFLPLKEAARTNIVSTNWRKLWTSHPNLCFDGSKDDRYTDEDVMKIEEKKFIETVNSIIQQHSGASLHKFSIKFRLPKEESLDHLDSWICFATSRKARIMDINLWPSTFRARPKKVYKYPLEALASQDGPFIQSLFLKRVSIEPHSDIAGFAKLRRLHLHYVQLRVNGDLPGLLNNCCALEDLEIFACYGVPDLSVPLHLCKLRHILISRVFTHSINFHVSGLTHFEYEGDARPIVLHGCSKLKVSLTFKTDSSMHDKDLVSRAFTAIPTISAVKVLNVGADMIEHEPSWTSQMDRMLKRPMYMFTRLRHLTCEIKIITRDANRHGGILQFAHYLDRTPELEVLQLHMLYLTPVGFWPGEATGSFSSPSTSLHHLKEVHMSGFRCYRPQMELLCGILGKGATLDNVTIQTTATMKCGDPFTISDNYEQYIREWARCTSERFGKMINIVK